MSTYSVYNIKVDNILQTQAATAGWILANDGNGITYWSDPGAGSMGPTGPQGATGNDGAVGATGPQGATGPTTIQSGLLTSGAFSGSPLFATVSLSTPYSASYSIVVSGIDLRSWSISNVSLSEFRIDTNSSVVLTGNVYWITNEITQ